MPYKTIPTTANPAHIIFIIDVNKSLDTQLGNQSLLELIRKLLYISLVQMVFRSQNDQESIPAYHIAIITAGDRVRDLFNGFKSAEEVLKNGIPEFGAIAFNSNVVSAFERVYELLEQELPRIQNCPAPIVVYLTACAPIFAIEPIVKRIMGMQVPDGNVLIENVYVGDNISYESIVDPFQWAGVLFFKQDPSSSYFLNACSGIPASYGQIMRYAGYSLDEWAFMMIPCQTPHLLGMGFYLAISGPWFFFDKAADPEQVKQMIGTDFDHFQKKFFSELVI